MTKWILFAVLTLLLVPAAVHAEGREAQHIRTTTPVQRAFTTCDTGERIEATGVAEQDLTIIADPTTHLTTLAIATREQGTAVNTATGVTYRYIFVDNETVHFANAPSSHDTFVTQAQPLHLIAQGRTPDYHGQVVRHVIYTADGIVDLVYKVDQPLCSAD